MGEFLAVCDSNMRQMSRVSFLCVSGVMDKADRKSGSLRVVGLFY